MSLPAVVLSVIIASFYAGLFHFLRARRASDLAALWIASILGFLAGALLGLLVPWSVLVIGEVHLLEATTLSAAALFLTRWLRAARS